MQLLLCNDLYLASKFHFLPQQQIFPDCSTSASRNDFFDPSNLRDAYKIVHQHSSERNQLSKIVSSALFFLEYTFCLVNYVVSQLLIDLHIRRKKAYSISVYLSKTQDLSFVYHFSLQKHGKKRRKCYQVPCLSQV